MIESLFRMLMHLSRRNHPTRRALALRYTARLFMCTFTSLCATFSLLEKHIHLECIIKRSIRQGKKHEAR